MRLRLEESEADLTRRNARRVSLSQGRKGLLIRTRMRLEEWRRGGSRGRRRERRGTRAADNNGFRRRRPQTLVPATLCASAPTRVQQLLCALLLPSVRRGPAPACLWGSRSLVRSPFRSGKGAESTRASVGTTYGDGDAERDNEQRVLATCCSFLMRKTTLAYYVFFFSRFLAAERAASLRESEAEVGRGTGRVFRLKFGERSLLFPGAHAFQWDE